MSSCSLKLFDIHAKSRNGYSQILKLLSGDSSDFKFVSIMSQGDKNLLKLFSYSRFLFKNVQLLSKFRYEKKIYIGLVLLN